MKQTKTDKKTASDAPEAPIQFNTLDTYADCGRKAGKAANQRDYSLMRFHMDWSRKAIRLETPEYAAKATYAFNEAYKAERS